MKRSLLLLLAAASLFACKSEPERILIKLTKGQKYRQHMVTKSTSNQTIMEKATSGTNISDAVNLAEVVDVKDSIYTIKMTYLSMWVKMIKDGDTIPMTGNPVEKVLEGLKGRTYLIKMSNTGHIIETIGADSLFINLINKMPGLPEDLKASMSKQLARAYGDKAIKQNNQFGSSLYPNKEIKAGDTWKAVRDGDKEIMLPKVEAVYKVDKITSAEYLISMKANISINNTGSNQLLPVQYNLNGTMTSTNKIDKKTGLVLETLMKQDISGNMKLTTMPNKGATTIPMQIKGETIVTNTFID